MNLYFEYARVTGDDRVFHGAILLRDAAESWWRAHVLETTTPTGEATADPHHNLGGVQGTSWGGIHARSRERASSRKAL